jgi:hypothetical protein
MVLDDQHFSLVGHASCPLDRIRPASIGAPASDRARLILRGKDCMRSSGALTAGGAPSFP